MINFSIKKNYRLIPLLFCLLIIIPYCFQTVSALSSSDEWVETGNKLFEQEKFDEAIMAYNNALNYDRGNADAWNGKAIVFSVTGNFDKALKATDMVIMIEPDYPGILCKKGSLSMITKRYHLAIDAYNKELLKDSSSCRNLPPLPDSTTYPSTPTPD